MIYIMSRCEKIDFMAFFDVRALKWLQNDPNVIITNVINYLWWRKHGEITALEDSKAAPEKVNQQYMSKNQN